LLGGSTVNHNTIDSGGFPNKLLQIKTKAGKSISRFAKASYV